MVEHLAAKDWEWSELLHDYLLKHMNAKLIHDIVTESPLSLLSGEGQQRR